MHCSGDSPANEPKVGGTAPLPVVVGGQGLPGFLWLVLHRTTRYTARLVALGTMGYSGFNAWDIYRDDRRGDGNPGHTFIDFGGQWLMGRLLVTGNGQNLYKRSIQRGLLEEAYPRENEIPTGTPHGRGTQRPRCQQFDGLADGSNTYGSFGNRRRIARGWCGPPHGPRPARIPRPA